MHGVSRGIRWKSTLCKVKGIFSFFWAGVVPDFHYLARSAKLPTGLYILFALMSIFLSFFMISRRQIISGSAGPIFAIVSPNESVLVADERSGPLFPIS